MNGKLGLGKESPKRGGEPVSTVLSPRTADRGIRDSQGVRLS